MHILAVGVKAYADCYIAGLIPCVVEAISGPAQTVTVYKTLAPTTLASSAYMVTVRLTANRGAYRKGEVIQRSALSIIPRGSVFTRAGQRLIRAYEIAIPEVSE